MTVAKTSCLQCFPVTTTTSLCLQGLNHTQEWPSQAYLQFILQVMKVVNDLIKVPELNQTMQQMSREMMKAGLIEETMGEMMDDALDTDDIEEDADAEVDKVSMPAALLPKILRWLSAVYLCMSCGHVFSLAVDAEVASLCERVWQSPLLDSLSVPTFRAGSKVCKWFWGLAGHTAKLTVLLELSKYIEK